MDVNRFKTRNEEYGSKNPFPERQIDAVYRSIACKEERTLGMTVDF